MKTRLLLLTAILITLSSCSGFTHVTVPNSSINYGIKDFETERYVEYTLTKSYILGIGGMSAKARNTNIIKELMKKANLQTNEALAYITISKNQNTFLGLITTIDFIASGYVVRPKGENPIVSSEYKDTPYKGSFQGKESIVAKYETTGGAKLVRKLQREIDLCKSREELLRLRKEVELAHINEKIDDKSSRDLLYNIDSKLVDCAN